MVQFEHDLEPVAGTSIAPALPAVQVQEAEFFREDEVFLQDPIARKGMRRIREERLCEGKPGGLQGIRREGTGCASLRGCEQNPVEASAQQEVEVG